MQSGNPLVSIIVITYNSGQYIIETLDSAKNQTYRNLELIISDDCSKDNTIELCKEWIDKNKERFVRIELLTTDKNTGIPANCNRAVKASCGELIKSIAGDDTMESNFVSRCVPEFQDPDCAVCFTNSYFINSDSEKYEKVDSSAYRSGYIFDDIFFLRFWPKGPSYMYRRDALFAVGLYDENIWVEDYLMLMKLTFRYKAKHVNEYLVNYRRHDSNSGNTSLKLLDSQLLSISFFNEVNGYRRRVNEIRTNKLFYISKYKKSLFLKEFIKYPRLIAYGLFWKSILYFICYWEKPHSTYKKIKSFFGK